MTHKNITVCRLLHTDELSELISKVGMFHATVASFITDRGPFEKTKLLIGNIIMGVLWSNVHLRTDVMGGLSPYQRCGKIAAEWFGTDT